MNIINIPDKPYFVEFKSIKELKEENYFFELYEDNIGDVWETKNAWMTWEKDIQDNFSSNEYMYCIFRDDIGKIIKVPNPNVDTYHMHMSKLLWAVKKFYSKEEYPEYFI